MERKIRNFIDKNKALLSRTLEELCRIPAPSHMEHKRAAYCTEWLEKVGAKGVYTDEALNVIYPLNCEESREITVLAAHTDTVFPDTGPMPFYDDGEKIHCPGAADDTASVAVLLMTAKFFTENNILPPRGIMFVFNSCEEGLGNLKGTKQLFADFKGRISRFVSLDSGLETVNDRCVGSRRFEVEVKTEGGHSYRDFGTPNAIAVLADIVSDMYRLEVPVKDGSRTTYNVGDISGGTSVNTVAQSAGMLCEYRSDNTECMEIMQEKFVGMFEKARKDGVEIKVTELGYRPCGNISAEKTAELKKEVIPVIESVLGKPLQCESASTDCNIPLSMGIPAICIGVCRFDGAHTREEWVEKASLVTGLEIAIKTALVLGKD